MNAKPCRHRHYYTICTGFMWCVDCGAIRFLGEDKKGAYVPVDRYWMRPGRTWAMDRERNSKAARAHRGTAPGPCDKSHDQA